MTPLTPEKEAEAMIEMFLENSIDEKDAIDDAILHCEGIIKVLDGIEIAYVADQYTHYTATLTILKQKKI